ncbi:hypothetical protein G7050_16585 [Dysgonomonas sp. HDW5A]|uniref:hypothetical protein n=1 Tax=Dysgonomonas sp. HDW5A TaxID=2714926 RepID=UPI0014073F80|nr:hypothetical protein [Dysgonomonas sp. HDW5A]QIK61371.1 hypothetical protein G7050_16585 [Dysgonomonas sp. HDW5A]
MKKVLFCLLSCIFLGFSACGGDDEDEVFITDDAQAKEMIIGKWVVKSVKLESNYSPFDELINKSFVQSLQQNTINMVFDKEYVVTTTIPKKDPSLTLNSREKYYFENNKIYVEDIDIKETLTHTYKISNSLLEMRGDFTRDILIKMLKVEGTINGIDYTEFINSIPQNFSGKLIYTLKK